MCEQMRRKGINGNLVDRIEEIYLETSNVVRVNGQTSKEFWTKLGVRQGCPLSPVLFAMYLGDIEDELRKGQVGGVVVGRRKFWTLAYADDLVVLAKSPEEMKEVSERLEKYVRRKNLVLNVDKSKMVIFQKAGGRRKRYDWKWGGEKIEEVNEFKYLGYTFKKNNSSERHIQEITKRAAAAMAQTWGLGKRKFGEDFERRMFMFDYLVKGIVMYGAEIWGWVRRDKVERLQERYIKWCLELDRCTPGYLVMEETKRERLGIEAAKRAGKFEERIRETSDNMVLKECWRERKQEEERGRITAWGKKRRDFYNRKGLNEDDIERMREEGVKVWEIIEEFEKEEQKEEQEDKIKNANYCRRYESIRTEQLPAYLQRKGGRGRQARLARFRCGNEERASRYWETEERKICRLCGKGKETLEHLVTECEEMERQERGTQEILDETGKGEAWMDKLIEKRKAKEKEEDEQQGSQDE